MNLPAISNQNLPTRKQLTRLFNGPTGRKIVHEAGHGLLNAKFAKQPTFILPQSPKAPDRPHGIMLALDSYYLNRVRFGRRYEDRMKDLRDPLCLLAGPAAEMLFYGACRVTTHDDIARAQELLEKKGYGATLADINIHLKHITAEFQTMAGEALLADLVMGISVAYLQHKVLPLAVFPGLN